jgi:hypothetical protein
MFKFRGFLGFVIIGLLSASGARAYPHPCHNYGDSLYDASLYYIVNGNAWLGCKAEGEVGPVCGDPEFVLMPTNDGTCHICVPSEYTAAIQSGTGVSSMAILI